MASHGSQLCPPGPAIAHVAFALDTHATVQGALQPTIEASQVVSSFVACTPETFETTAGINFLERTETANYHKEAHLISIIILKK